MPYSIVVNHRHKSANKTLVQGCPLLISALATAHSKTRTFTDPVTGAEKIQVEDEPLYNVFNVMEGHGWSLVNGFSAGTAEQYIFHREANGAPSGIEIKRAVIPPPPSEGGGGTGV
mmetsp:Transcript_1011/g.1843  ORF Transcript_1011/g.1843 Transcript_1011/m.1843 type:complete len:116 (+) Transcript_1011:228-575(+)